METTFTRKELTCDGGWSLTLLSRELLISQLTRRGHIARHSRTNQTRSRDIIILGRRVVSCTPLLGARVVSLRILNYYCYKVPRAGMCPF